MLHGQQPAVVDVLANDYDPQGWILGVPAPRRHERRRLHVAVIDQHWLRISSDDPRPGTTATVNYTVSDGQGSATGTVGVTAVPAVTSADQITTRDDLGHHPVGRQRRRPRAGRRRQLGRACRSRSATVTPTAAPAIAGLLAGDQGANVRVDAPRRRQGRGRDDRQLRRDRRERRHRDRAPATSRSSRRRRSAHPDQAPVSAGSRHPRDRRRRRRSSTSRPTGSTRTATPTAVTGGHGAAQPRPDRRRRPRLDLLPVLPGLSGTDTFTYQVTDPYGLTGTATVRIAMLPPGPPQPPVAVDDVINAPPGATLHSNVLGNDFVAAGRHGHRGSRSPGPTGDLPAGVRLIGSYVYLRVPARAVRPAASSSPTAITDGGGPPSLAQVIVRAVAGAKVPPVASDDVAPPPQASGARRDGRRAQATTTTRPGRQAT